MYVEQYGKEMVKHSLGLLQIKHNLKILEN